MNYDNALTESNFLPLAFSVLIFKNRPQMLTIDLLAW